MRRRDTTDYIRYIIAFLLVCMAVLGAVELLIHHPSGNEFYLESALFFNLTYGVFACALIIIVSKILGVFLKKPENYYKED